MTLLQCNLLVHVQISGMFANVACFYIQSIAKHRRHWSTQTLDENVVMVSETWSSNMLSTLLWSSLVLWFTILFNFLIFAAHLISYPCLYVCRYYCMHAHCQTGISGKRTSKVS